MKKFIIEKSFWDLFPDAKIGVLVLKGIQSQESNDEIINLLAQANLEAKKYLVAELVSENKEVAVWRKAYQKFKTKKGARCSIEALLKRVNSGKGVSTINALVDIYNAASLKYALPCGAEDIDKFKGDLRLTISAGGDKFIGIGEDDLDETLAGELCYLDDDGAVCRCFNWRDGIRTMIDDNTKSAFVVMEVIDNRLDDLHKALAFIKNNSEKYLRAVVDVHILDLDHQEINL